MSEDQIMSDMLRGHTDTMICGFYPKQIAMATKLLKDDRRALVR